MRTILPKFRPKTLYALILEFTPRHFNTLVNKHGSGEYLKKTPIVPKMVIFTLIWSQELT